MLKKIPSEQDFIRLYWELSQIGAPAVGDKREWAYAPKTKEALISLSFEMLRYDPRLLTILMIYFLNHWTELNPLILRSLILKIEFPQVVGVVKEFLTDYSSDMEIKYFFEYLSKGLKPVQPQLFFMGLYAVGSERQVRIAQKSLKQYSRWGFLGIERPQVNLSPKETVGSYDIETRSRMALQYLKQHQTMSLKEYLDVLDHCISRQQALYDLKRNKQFKLMGQGRGARWKKVA